MEGKTATIARLILQERQYAYIKAGWGPGIEDGTTAMKTAVWWLVAALLFSGLLGRLAHVNAELDAERAAHAVTEQERQRWQAAAEAYRKDAEAQAENARLCLDREAKNTREEAERAAIMQQARPRARTVEEKAKVVDDETRRRAVLRLNRPL